MQDNKPNPDQASLAAELVTLRDYLRLAVSRFTAAGLSYGHGTTTALDDAAFLLLEALSLPVDKLDPFLDARLTLPERLRLLALIEERISTRKPSAYLLGRTYLAGIPFHVDERAIIPRSFIAELLFSDLLDGDGGLIEDPTAVASVLDLCTGSGSIAILAAEVFANAEIHAVDLSAAALELARRNIAERGAGGRIVLFEGDLFDPVGRRRYDLILTNPPYVDEKAMAGLPPEHRHEPAMALAGGRDGLDLVRRILAGAPRHLTRRGALMCEIGSGRRILEEAFPRLPFLWLDTEESKGEVFWLRKEDFRS
ncbi:MAG: 50S ribosomal protein L3 N(5)-glutamine methyltransferase [Methylobacteriaceae bacterium]|nr:50S ribosomal protein L3 N(5)-glutamine methyltransferase [Methylobacteriaceae bacterium]